MRGRGQFLLVAVFVAFASFSTASLEGSEQSSVDLSPIPAKEFQKWLNTHIQINFEMLQENSSRPVKVLSRTTDAGKLMASPSAQVLDGRKVSLMGYMIPLEMDDKGVSAFVLAPHLATCCFSVIGKPNDLVLVLMPKKTVFAENDPVTVFGTFHVNRIEKGTELNGQSLYQMDGAALAVHTAAFEKAIGAP